MRVENRLVLCYTLPNEGHFWGAWHALERLHQEHGERLFLYAYGVRLLDAPAWVMEYRLLALVMRETALRDLDPVVLGRLADVLGEHEATYIAHVPEVLTVWFADLSEWHDGEGMYPKPPAGLELVLDPSPNLIIAEVSDDGGETWRPMTEAEKKEYA